MDTAQRVLTEGSSSLVPVLVLPGSFSKQIQLANLKGKKKKKSTYFAGLTVWTHPVQGQIG